MEKKLLLSQKHIRQPNSFVKIWVFNKQKTLPIQQREVESIACGILAKENVICDELAIYFVNKKKIRDLHSEFFNDPTTTDCITFPLDPPKKDRTIGSCFLGEIFICCEVALEYAQKHGIDPLDELRLYLIHGLLHLSGYKDQTNTERRVMRKKEKECMNTIKKFLKKNHE
jgi:probable rRNA maturation factor